MKDWRNAVISPQDSILKTIRVINESVLQIALVVTKDQRLLGTVTDGDIRRAILKNISLESSIQNIMNIHPTTSKVGESSKTVLSLMRMKKLKHLPVIDDNGKLFDLLTLDEVLQRGEHNNPVILMAGGLGTRLRPLTEHIPKPLLKVGNKSILETILESFIDYNFRNFYISVNYKSEMIKQVFGNGEQWGVSIKYIDEDKRMGTAGALSLMPELPEESMIVMNGDLLTKVNFEQLLDFHEENESIATMCVREFQQQVPYGVVEFEGNRFMGVAEKPTNRYFVNAGIYVLNPIALNYIPRNQFFDMPNLFSSIKERDFNSVIFPIREYWIDVGRMSDFEQANSEFSDIFG